MTEFLRTEDFYALGGEPGPALAHVTDLRSAAENCSDLDERKRYYKQLGDFALFMLGPSAVTQKRPLMVT